MKPYKDGTIGKRKIGDPILAKWVDEALDVPRNLLNHGRKSGSYPLDEAMSEVLDYVERVTNLERKSQGVWRDGEFEVTRRRALRAIWGAYQWLQDNTSRFEMLGVRLEPSQEREQRRYLGYTLESYEAYAEKAAD